MPDCDSCRCISLKRRIRRLNAHHHGRSVPTVYLDLCVWGGARGGGVEVHGREQQPNTFAVSSSVMRLASSIWHITFDPIGPFKDAKESSQRVRFSRDLAVLRDKYGTVYCIRLWLPRWRSQPRFMIIISDPEELLFMAWTFGDYTSSVTHSTALVTSCHMGRLTRGGKAKVFDFAPGPYRRGIHDIETCF